MNIVRLNTVRMIPCQTPDRPLAMERWDHLLRQVYCLVDGQRDVRAIALLLHQPTAPIYSRLMELCRRELIDLRTYYEELT